MPINDKTQDRPAPFFPYPVSEALSRYLAMTAPGISRTTAPDRAIQPSAAIGAGEADHTQLEDLWDLLGDFA
jgi:hypothetical protein